jgi:hypothetical protein
MAQNSVDVLSCSYARIVFTRFYLLSFPKSIRLLGAATVIPETAGIIF